MQTRRLNCLPLIAAARPPSRRYRKPRGEICSSHHERVLLGAATIGVSALCEHRRLVVQSVAVCHDADPIFYATIDATRFRAA